MTHSQFEILRHPGVQAIIEENIMADPLCVAADKSIARRLEVLLGPGSGGREAVATQVKYLQRARTKFPAYYQARCIIPPLSFEQAGSAECAAHKMYSGRVCIDLTCGLGVDSTNFSKHFDRVISLEFDPLLADIARYNFARMGINNIEVINTSAEDFLAHTDIRVDMVYADPDRRGSNNRKLVLLEDCSPDVVALHRRMHEISPVVLIKTSPLFDPAEAFRIFGPHTRVEALSLKGECKELLIETGVHITGPTVKASVAGGDSVEWLLAESSSYGENIFAPPYRYLIDPDVALRKMRMARAYFSRQGAFMDSDNGYAFSNDILSGGLCRVYETDAIYQYKPRAIADMLREKGIARLQIMQRGFHLDNVRIAKQLSVKEGSDASAVFCTVAGGQYAVFLK